MPIYKEITERMPGGFIVYEANASEKILFANSAAIKIFGCSTFDEFMNYVKGSFLGMIYSDDLTSVEESINSQVNNTENNTDHVLYRIKRKDGSIRWLEDFGHLVHTEKGDLFYVFLYDVTEKKLAEEEAKRAEEAFMCEKSLNEAKNAFIFNLSHDFRTPMNAIIGYLQLAKQHVKEPEVCLDHLAKVETASHLLLALLDDLLELAALDARGVQLKATPVNFAAAITDAVDLFRPELTKKKLQLNLDLAAGQTEVLLDAPRFQRALANLLSNACKFTPEGGSITVAIKRTRESESGGFARFQVSVTDTGIGMEPEFVKRAFGAFEREETSTKSGRIGTGIGLTVCKRILDIMGGSVEAQSTKGQGSTFTLSLPLKLVQPKPHTPSVTHAEPAATPTTGKGRILLVEDIEINRMMAETILSEFGFDVESVPDGCDAVDIVCSKPPHYYTAILMDIQMPVMNGYEATRAIRAHEREDLQTLPIIALSANARPEDKEQSFASGMNAHVAKPFDVEGLIATIDRYRENPA